MLNKNLLFSRNKFNHFNFRSIFEIKKSVLLVLLSILSFSIVCLYSSAGGRVNTWVVKQISYIVFSLLVFVLLVSINTKNIYKFSNIALLVSIFLLLIVIPFGKRAMGASRWIDFGIFTIQPSEMAKIALVLFLSRYFSKVNSKKIKQFKNIVLLFLMCSPIFVLVAIQPDLATSVILFALFMSMLFFIGFPLKYFICGIIFLISTTPFIWKNLLKEYQKLRIINFIFPENDPLGSGYNIIQSKIAIGSGGVFGKGFLQGTQGRLRFLPEHHTDFIFTIVGEEFGIIGCLFLISLYLLIIIYGLNVLNKTKSVFGKSVCFGCLNIIFLHIFINIGMTIGLFPVAGIPLIMFSYGGSSLLLGMICIALLINIDINKNFDN